MAWMQISYILLIPKTKSLKINYFKNHYAFITVGYFKKKIKGSELLVILHRSGLEGKASLLLLSPTEMW